MDEKTVQSAMEIILNAGDARLKNKEALEAVAQGDLAAAHEKMEYSLLFTHAQDTLMTINSEITITKQLVSVFEAYDARIAALEAKLA